jgi:carboxylate-amine ligase
VAESGADSEQFCAFGGLRSKLWRLIDVANGDTSLAMSDLPSAATTSFQHAYGESSPFSIGVEEEFQLVHPDTFELVSRIEELLGRANDSDRQSIKHELMQSVLEVASPVCANTAEANETLSGLRNRVEELAAASDCKIASAGTHPFSRYEFQKVTDDERYKDIMSRLRWIAQRELIFGLHVHVGIASPEMAMYVFNHIRSYLPHMLALSANSPFWQGRHTGLRSTRSKIFDSFPRSGIPQTFESWQEWEALVRRAMNAGAIGDYTYIWWDVRPHPRFGTVEVRICDAQTRIEDSLALAALIQATAAWLGAQFDEGFEPAHHPSFLINENKWSAARYGIEGEFIDLETDRTVPTRDAIEELIGNVRPFATELGSAAEFAHLDNMLISTGADRQLTWYENSDSLMSVGDMLVRETVGGSVLS